MPSGRRSHRASWNALKVPGSAVTPYAPMMRQANSRRASLETLVWCVCIRPERRLEAQAIHTASSKVSASAHIPGMSSALTSIPPPGARLHRKSRMHASSVSSGHLAGRSRISFSTLAMEHAALRAVVRSSGADARQRWRTLRPDHRQRAVLVRSGSAPAAEGLAPEALRLHGALPLRHTRLATRASELLGDPLVHLTHSSCGGGAPTRRPSGWVGFHLMRPCAPGAWPRGSAPRGSPA